MRHTDLQHPTFVCDMCRTKRQLITPADCDTSLGINVCRYCQAKMKRNAATTTRARTRTGKTKLIKHHTHQTATFTPARKSPKDPNAPKFEDSEFIRVSYRQHNKCSHCHSTHTVLWIVPTAHETRILNLICYDCYATWYMPLLARGKRHIAVVGARPTTVSAYNHMPVWMQVLASANPYAREQLGFNDAPHHNPNPVNTLQVAPTTQEVDNTQITLSKLLNPASQGNGDISNGN